MFLGGIMVFFLFRRSEKRHCLRCGSCGKPWSDFQLLSSNFQDQAQHISQVKAKSRGGSNCGSMADFSTEIVDNLEGLRDPAVGGNLGFWYICML